MYLFLLLPVLQSGTIQGYFYLVFIYSVRTLIAFFPSFNVLIRLSILVVPRASISRVLCDQRLLDYD